MRFLFVRVQGGLCNRLRVVLSAEQWARKANRRLYVTWPAEPSFGASLDDLWVTSLRQLPSEVTSVAARLAGGYKVPADLALDDAAPLQVVSTYEVFGDENGELPWFDSLDSIRPVDEICEQVRRHAQQWSGATVGVMIRAHPASHPDTLEASPLPWFLERMQQMRDIDPGVEFFLSTDVPQVSSEVHARFPNVWERPTTAPYNSREAVRKAVCDLYLLSGCTYILGSYFSSFSQTAHLLAGHGGYETTVDAPSEPWERRRAIPTAPRL